MQNTIVYGLLKHKKAKLIMKATLYICIFLLFVVIATPCQAQKKKKKKDNRKLDLSQKQPCFTEVNSADSCLIYSYCTGDSANEGMAKLKAENQLKRSLLIILNAELKKYFIKYTTSELSISEESVNNLAKFMLFSNDSILATITCSKTITIKDHYEVHIVGIIEKSLLVERLNILINIPEAIPNDVSRQALVKLCGIYK